MVSLLISARCFAKDPLAAKYPAFSPYAYCAGDPVNLVDLDGTMIDDFVFDDPSNHGLVKGSLYLLNNSDASNIESNGALDFITQSYIPQLVDDNSYLYISYTEKDGFVAHYAHNYGNFLWGAAANALGVPQPIAKAGAHYHNFFLDSEHKGTLDSRDDQYSISIGYNWK